MPVVPRSIFANSHYLAVWLQASNRTIQANPGDLKALNVHFALNEFHKLYHLQPESSLASLEKRHQTFNCLEEAAKQGDARAIFFLGLCYIEGSGCEKNPKLGNNLIEMSAMWLKCDLAISYIKLCLGLAYMYGNKENNIQPELRTAAEYLISSGPLGLQAKNDLMQHVIAQELRLAQVQRAELVHSDFVPKYRRPILVSG